MHKFGKYALNSVVNKTTGKALDRQRSLLIKHLESSY